MSGEPFYKDGVLAVHGDARIVAIKDWRGTPLFRVYSDRMAAPLSAYQETARAAWAEAYADLPRGVAGYGAGQMALGWGGPEDGQG